jgi:hypothetical protein
MDEQMWRRYVDAARLAPSKHNAQPWWFEVSPDGSSIEIHADGARAMPASDPEGRELVIGCGAAFYNLCLAIRHDGHEPLVVLFPDGAAFSVVARVTVDGAHLVTEEERRLFAAIPERHSNRNPLDRAGLDPEVPFLLQDAAASESATLHLVTTHGARQAVRDLLIHADNASARDPRIEAELHQWIRPPDVLAPDGIPATAVGRGAAASYRASFVQRDFDVHGARPSGRPYPPRNHDDPLVGVLWTAEDRAADWLRAGSALEAVLLTATAHGAAASLLNQPIEIPALRTALRTELALPGHPQAIVRVGIGAPVPPTPRRPVDDVVLRP